MVKQPKVIDIGESYTVNVTIQKQKISGISKFEIEIPDGFAIRAIETSGSQFMKEPGVGKFIWLNLPNAENITVSYQIYVPLNTSKEYTIKSTFYYLNGKNKISTSYASYFEVELSKENLSLLEINKLLDSYKNQDIFFKVQLGAFRKALKKETIQNYFGVKGKVTEIYDHNLYKYTIGTFSDYFEAKKYQENCGVKGAFLVLYFIDVKISKNDAIKIMQH